MRAVRLAWAMSMLLAAECIAADMNRLTPQEKKDGFVLLFNGKNLDSWSGDPGAWSVQDGSIVGSTDNHKIAQNTFLIHKDQRSDFVLRAQIRLRNGNSGIHFRSRQLPGPGWIVTGYQADASDAGDRSAWGNFYEERGRSRTMMKTPDEGWLKAKSVLRKQDWNDYEVLAEGSHIRITFNGVVTIDTAEDKWLSGIVALQMHTGEPMRVEFRNIRLKRLP
ncbi:MAG: DUF1080 domain-containing protein [Bryobacteraceae bacterium]